VHRFVVDAAPQSRSGSKRVTMKSKSANHHTQRTPRLRYVCILNHWRGAAGVGRSAK